MGNVAICCSREGLAEKTDNADWIQSLDWFAVPMKPSNARRAEDFVQGPAFRRLAAPQGLKIWRSRASDHPTTL